MSVRRCSACSVSDACELGPPPRGLQVLTEHNKPGTLVGRIVPVRPEAKGISSADCAARACTANHAAKKALLSSKVVQ